MANIFKAIGHGFKKAGTVIAHVFTGHSEEIQKQIKTLAVEAIEGISHLDLDGDGKVDTIAEMIPKLAKMATQYGWKDLGYLGQKGVELGVPAAANILAQVLPDADIKSWLAVTRIGAQLDGLASKIPLSGLRYAVEATVSELKTVTKDPSTAEPPAEDDNN